MTIKDLPALYAVELTVNGNVCLWITATPPGQLEGYFVPRVTATLSDIYGMIQRLLSEQPTTSDSPRLST